MTHQSNNVNTTLLAGLKRRPYRSMAFSRTDNVNTTLLARLKPQLISGTLKPLVQLAYIRHTEATRTTSQGERTMRNQNNNTQMTAVFVMALQSFPNPELAALNNAARWLDTIPPSNKGFKLAEEAGLIDDKGRWVDIENMRTALAYEVNRRIDEGTFTY